MRPSLIFKAGVALIFSAQKTFAADWEGVPSVGTTIGGVQYLGCAAQVPGGVLAPFLTRDSMPIEDCHALCSGATYTLFGLTNGKMCSCGRSISVNANLPGTPADCNMPCKLADGSDSKQMCGGSKQISVFNATNYAGPGPVMDDPLWQYAGCYMEPATGGHYMTLKQSGTDMTVQKCLAVCNKQLWMFAGLENGSDCYCGKIVFAHLDDASNPACALQCDTTCPGNASQICGGAYTFSAYARLHSY